MMTERLVRSLKTIVPFSMSRSPAGRMDAAVCRVEVCYPFRRKYRRHCSEPALVHHAHRRRGGVVAARGAGAASEELADHWVPGRGHGSGSEAMDRRFCATATGSRLDRGSQHRDRIPVVGGTHRTRRRDGGRVRPAQGRCHCHGGRCSPRGKAGDIGHSNRLRRSGGPSWQRSRGVTGATGWQRHTLALGARLPTLYPNREYLQAGGLMSFGPSFSDLFRHAADYVDKILRGAKPGDLPVEQPTKFELVINLTAAKALRLTIPESFLA